MVPPGQINGHIPLIRYYEAGLMSILVSTSTTELKCKGESGSHIPRNISKSREGLAIFKDSDINVVDALCHYLIPDGCPFLL